MEKLKLLPNTVGMGISISKAFCYMHGIVEVGNIDTIFQVLLVTFRIISTSQVYEGMFL